MAVVLTILAGIVGLVLLLWALDLVTQLVVECPWLVFLGIGIWAAYEQGWIH